MNAQPASTTRNQLTEADKLFLVFSFLLVGSYFLPWLAVDDVSPMKAFAGVVKHESRPMFVYALPFVFLAPVCVRRKTLRPWLGIAAAILTCLSVAQARTRGGELAAGAVLALCSSVAVLLFSATPALIRRTELGVQRLNSRKADVSSHTFTAVPRVHFSGSEFYERLSKWIGERNWPGVEILRVPYTEAGAFSHRREYLRVVRHRQVIDFCAAPFGTDYFFSMREAEMKPPVSIAQLVGTLAIFLIAFGVCLEKFGVITGLIIFCVLAVLGALLLFNLLRLGLTRVDGLLMRVPTVGPIYENFFRASGTYFQHDTRVVFLALVKQLIEERLRDETSDKGLKLLEIYEHQPILQDFYQRRLATIDDGNAPSEALPAA